ncbi:hypothetical protein [Sphingomonas panacis]|nr:hypothetical protein [Sphingomonas panacis]
MIRVTFHAQLSTAAKDSPAGIMDPVRMSHVLYNTWLDRRTIAWHVSDKTPTPRQKSHSTAYPATLVLDYAAASALPNGPTARLSIDVDLADAQDPVEKAKRLLDLPIVIAPRYRRPGNDRSFGGASFHTIKGASVIGPMPAQWPVDRTITAYSQYLGSYGQGGVGLSGWQLNGGSWIVLPISDSQSWITLTKEEMNPSADRARLDIKIDQRIIGVHPNGMQEFWPWEHRYCSHDPIMDLPDFAQLRPRVVRFAATASGFLLEAGDGGQTWRFEMGDHLPRPRWGGTGTPRDLYDGENVAATFILTHGCYLDV